MKWEVVEPKQGQYDFSQADQLVAFAKAHGQKVRGHNLVWHNQLPSWLTSGTWTPAQLRAILKEHIFTEAGHCPWSGSGPGTSSTRRSTTTATSVTTFWCARWARELHRRRLPLGPPGRPEGDPLLQRLQHRILRQEERLRSTSLVQRPRAQGVADPGGLGFQGHLSTDYPLPPTTCLQNMRRFGRARDLTTAVTEADVRFHTPRPTGQGQRPGPRIQPDAGRAAFSSAAASPTRSGVSPTSTTGCPPPSPVRGRPPRST